MINRKNIVYSAAFSLLFSSANCLANQITNGSFESGITGWTTGGVIEIAGPPVNSPIGSDGQKSVVLGPFNVANSFILQSFPVQPSKTYNLTFDSIANANGVPNKTAVLQVSLFNSVSSPLAQPFFVTNISTAALLNGTNGFLPNAFSFNTPAGVTSATIKFADITPDGGIGVDILLDDIQVNEVVPIPVLPLVVNGSFEDGTGDLFTGWDTHRAYRGGPTFTQAMGTDGTHAANLGWFDTQNATMSQLVGVTPTYKHLMTFDSIANANGVAGKQSTLRVEILTPDGAPLIPAKTIHQISPDFILQGGLGFEPQAVEFNVPLGLTHVVIKFSDLTPNGAAGIDIVIDNVRLGPIEPVQQMGVKMAAAVELINLSGLELKIEYSNDVASTNWTELTTLVVPSNLYYYIDTNSIGQPKRFYRSVILE